MAQTTEFIKEAIFSPTFDLQKQYATYTGILKNAVEGKVVTRFPPEPSGYLHIGHCKAALLNYHYAKMYKGNMILRFDDTNPSKEKNEYVEAIIEDLKTLGITYSVLTYTSDYFPKIFELLRGLIERGGAYLDNTPVDKMREERTKKIESAPRHFTVEQNLALFDKLLAGRHLQYVIHHDSQDGETKRAAFVE